MRYRILIIDDTMPPAKGYGSIEEWFPGRFEVHEARTFAIECPGDKAAPTAVALLKSIRFDVILVDFNLLEGDHLGAMAVYDIRNRLEGHVADASEGDLNKDAYIIGVSGGWDQNGQSPLLRLLKRKQLVRGLDGATTEKRSLALQLREELQKFLASRGG